MNRRAAWSGRVGSSQNRYRGSTFESKSGNQRRNFPPIRDGLRGLKGVFQTAMSYESGRKEKPYLKF